ncbi:unnamed protein product [Rhodiola kirilowii]
MSIHDSFWKLSLLKPGQFDWCKDQFEAHVCSLDGQLWRIFETGPLPIPLDITDPTKPVEKSKDNYTDEDYKCLEKNARAKKVLYMALSLGDQIKVAMYKTAKDMYDGLVRLYGGNQDIKRNRILAATKDYEMVMQKKDESLEDFNTRFQVIVGQLDYLDEKLPEWKITHQFMQALNSKWDHVTLALQAQRGIKDTTLEELVANLQSQPGIVEREMARRQTDKSQAIALKVEKALTKADESSKEEDDEIALLTRALTRANFGKGRNYKSEGSRGNSFRGNRDSGNSSRGNNNAGSNENGRNSGQKEDRTCYHCQKKGHLSRDCYSKKKGEPPVQKGEESVPKQNHAMFAVWGDTDEDSDDGNRLKEACFMAHSTTNEVTDTDSFIDKVFSESDLAETISKVLAKNRNLEDRLAEMQQDHHDDIEENHLWSTKAMRLEKEMVEHVCTCRTCEGRVKQISELSDELERMKIGNTELADFHAKVEELNDELINLRQNNEELLQTLVDLRREEAVRKEEWLHELEAKRAEEEKRDFKKKFVRPGLGYEEERAATEKAAKGKGKMTEPEECSRQKTRTHDMRNAREEIYPQKEGHLYDKDSVPFKAGKAYNIWQKMSLNNKHSMTDIHARKSKSYTPPGRSKYVDLPCHRTCWHCGQLGHYRADSPRLRETYERGSHWMNIQRHYPTDGNRREVSSYRQKGRNGHFPPNHDPAIFCKPRKTPRRKIDLTNYDAHYSYYSVPIAKFIPNPSKPKLV